MKTCTKCKIRLPDDAFYERADRPGRSHSWCTDCMKALRVSRNPQIATAQAVRRMVSVLGGGTKCSEEGCDRGVISRGLCNVHYQRMYVLEKPDAQRASKLKSMYGITRDQYQQLLDEQNGVCAICKKSETRVHRGKVCELSVDHDENTGAVRGLLCFMCNLGIGCFYHEPGLLECAITYLQGGPRFDLMSEASRMKLIEILSSKEDK
jgi:hypothetical protein